MFVYFPHTKRDCLLLIGIFYIGSILAVENAATDRVHVIAHRIVERPALCVAAYTVDNITDDVFRAPFIICPYCESHINIVCQAGAVRLNILRAVRCIVVVLSVDEAAHDGISAVAVIGDLARVETDGRRIEVEIDLIHKHCPLSIVFRL